MKDIALIATYHELAELGREVAQEMNLEIKIELGLLDEAIPVARRLKDQGCQVIISRGGTFRKLQQADLGIPMVGIRFTGYDMIRTLQEARSVGSNIALLISNDMVYDISNLGSIFNLVVKEYRIQSELDNEATILRAKADGAEVVIAGASVLKCAQAYGIPSFLVKSGKEAIWLALAEAREVANIRRKEQERANRLQAILDFAYEGIIVLDSLGKIDIFNSEAEKVLGISGASALERPWQVVIPEFRLSRTIANGQKEIGKLIEKSNKQFVTNKIPIEVNENTVGAVVTFQEVSQLQHLEQDIRKKLHTKGHVARYTFDDIIGESADIFRCIEVSKEYARVNSSVLLLGETGVGKEILAQSIHNESQRSNGPFVAINCAVLPENLLESELFGYAEGAFTGARKKGRAGLFELAHGGTIFLDEVGEMTSEIQSRLLRVLEEKEVMRLGDEKIVPINVRVIAATNKNIKKMVEQGFFREDLYYRLNVLKLYIPPLRRRPQDISLLVFHFLNKCNKKFGKHVTQISERAMDCLRGYEWPGNVRQLENFIERLVVLKNTSTITVDDIRTAFAETNEFEQVKTKVINLNPSGTNLYSLETEAIQKALHETGNNYSKAAKILGINRTTLWRKLKKLGL